MNTKEILDHLRHCLPRLAPQFRAETPLHELGLDSMDTVELLCAIHEEFGVRIAESEFSPTMTLDTLTGVIAQKITTVTTQ
ncbi:MAG: hypothetical protein JNK37_20920 [Verrucomicrobiales bacterium]|nr:hypothetical protein [Verrucomicrobiales bacterium]